MSISVELAYALCSRIAAIAIIIASGERIAAWREFRPGGIFNPEVNMAGFSVGGLLPSADVRRTTYVASHAVRILAALVLLLRPEGLGVMAAAWALIAVASLTAEWQYAYGGEDGAGQMISIMSVAFAMSLTFGLMSSAEPVGLYFMGAQACLAYVTAGVAKLMSPHWRSGAAVSGVLSTRTYGMPLVTETVHRFPVIALAACWGTIAFELAFLFALVMPATPLLLLFGVATMFHISTAIVMGLNGFLWSFISTYPAVVFLNQAILDLR